MDLVAQMVESENAVEEHQHTVGHIEVIGGVFADIFQPPHNVIGAVADRPRGKRRQTLNRCGTMLLQEFFDYRENISGTFLDFAATFDCDFITARFQAQKTDGHREMCSVQFFLHLQPTPAGRHRVRHRQQTERRETGVSRSAEMDFATGTNVAPRDRRANSLWSGRIIYLNCKFCSCTLYLITSAWARPSGAWMGAPPL